jgi:exopolysaccharide biosynthesis polyprenyl glycosylphosphotransferase
MGFASAFSELPVSFNVAPMDSLDRPLASQVAMFDDLLTIQVHRPPLSLWDRSIKRTFDVAAAAIGLILLLPLFIAVSVAIRLDSRGPILFRQTRHGFNNEAIRVFKFRSMTTTENGDDFTQVVKNDPRVTRIGRILRATNIDELPQLINVLLGSMSIVGPRPHATAHNEIFLSKIPPLSRRHNVKPGITGWAQVNGFRGETDTIEKMQKRIDHDLQYIDNWSFMFDMKIIMMTLFSKKAYVNAY